MVDIGGYPIVWHIMKIFSHHGINDFILCLGYKGYVIKEYFANYFLHNSDVTFDMSTNATTIRKNFCEPWRVTLVDTGLNSMTGGRLKRVAHLLQGEEAFCFTYGDGVADVDITKLIKFHQEKGQLATVTAVRPPGRYGVLSIGPDSLISGFKEKPEGDQSWINGGFFVLSPKAIDYIEGDASTWEREPMERLTQEGQLVAYRHDGFWQAMDTLRDKMMLEELWAKNIAPWRSWNPKC